MWVGTGRSFEMASALWKCIQPVCVTRRQVDQALPSIFTRDQKDDQHMEAAGEC